MCDYNIHQALHVKDDQLVCLFFYEQIYDSSPKKESCCENPDFIYDNKAEYCKNCGSHQRYLPENGYIDFYNQMYRFKRKSVNDRKYHIQNKIDLLMERHGLKIAVNDRHKIIKIFKESIKCCQTLIIEERESSISIIY